ncbi:MAG: hypothetical protein LUG94_00400 [Ruminococcus sp.]|nr:hypothetical protein [Ruminococcus sp.]
MRLKFKKYKNIKFKPIYSAKVEKGRYFTVLQSILIFILVVISFVVSCSGFYIKPILFIPIAITLAIFFEDELKSALVGGVCGLLLDISSHRLFGFNGVLLLISCVVTTLLFKNYLKPMFFNAIVFVGLTTFIQGFLDYFFYYKLWYSNVSDVIYFNYTLPSNIMTLVCVLFVYPLIKKIRTSLVAK